MSKTIEIRHWKDHPKYAWAGWPYEACVVSIISGKRLDSVAKLKAEIRHICKDKKPKPSKEYQEIVFQAIRHLDIGGGTKEDLEIIKEFAALFDAKVIFER
jgi:hypothetical protein